MPDSRPIFRPRREVPPPPPPDPPDATADTSMPTGFTVDEVKEYVTDHPDERDAILAAEQAGKNRVTLVEWLDNFGV